MNFQTLLVVVLNIFAMAHARPEGAPAAACESMLPAHFSDPQTSESPYSLTAVANGDGTYQVFLERTSSSEFDNFRGFFIQARSEATGTNALGEFAFEDTGLIQGRPCPGGDVDNGVTHTNAVDLKEVIESVWTPGVEGTDGVYFVASVVLNFSTYWVDIRSATL